MMLKGKGRGSELDTTIDIYDVQCTKFSLELLPEEFCRIKF